MIKIHVEHNIGAAIDGNHHKIVILFHDINSTTVSNMEGYLDEIHDILWDKNKYTPRFLALPNPAFPEQLP